MMKLLRFACSLTLAGALQSQTPNLPVVVREKNVAELQKVRAVLVTDGAYGLHPDPETDLALNSQFSEAIAKQLERLTCLHLEPGTTPKKKTPGDVSTGLLTFVEERGILNAAQRSVTYEVVFQITVLGPEGTLWDGSMRLKPARCLWTAPAFGCTVKELSSPAQIQSVVVGMLKALAEDACPGTRISGTGFSAASAAPSFDCAKAVSKAEKLICSSAELSNADVVMAAAYRKSISAAKAILPDAAANLKQDQIRWIRENGTCKDSAGLNERYRERIAFLEEYLRATATDSAPDDEATAAFLKRYPWGFRFLPVLLQRIQTLLGSEHGAFDSAMEIVHIDAWPDPSAITGNARNLNCALEAIVAVNGDKRLAVAVASADAISVFSEQRLRTLAPLPGIKGWVEEFQKRCGGREVVFR